MLKYLTYTIFFLCDNLSSLSASWLVSKGPVMLIQRVNIARSFLQSVLNLFHFIILNLPM